MNIPDLLPTVVAAFICPVVFVFPGYAAASLTDAFAFRARVFSMRIAVAVALSLSTLPIMAFLAARGAGAWAMWSLIGIMSVAGLSLMTRDAIAIRGRAFGASRSMLVFGVLWVLLSSVALMDVISGDRLFQSMTTHDFVKHTAVTNAITRTGVPPISPSFYPHHSFQLVYYYFWFLLASIVDQLGGSYVTARAAVLASIWWTGFGVACLAFVYLRLNRSRANLRVVLAIALGLLFANGLDIVPVGPKVFKDLLYGHAPRYASVEWWNEQVTGWFASMVWVPHHIAGLIASLTSLALIHYGTSTKCARRRWSAMALAASGFASAAGLSVWIALTIALVGTAWFLVLAYRRRGRESVGLAVAGCIAGLLAMPFIRDLSTANQFAHSPVQVSVRLFFPAIGYLMNHGINDEKVQTAVLLATLPLNYALELGVFAFAGVACLVWRRRSGKSWTESDLFEITILLTSVLVATFLRSTVHNNDLGWRSFLPAQFILLLWSARYLAARRSLRWMRPIGIVLIGALALGFATTALDIVLARATLPFAERSHTAYRWVGRYVLSTRQAFYTRQAYLALNKFLPATSIIQHNPDVALDLFEGSYGDRQVVAADDMYGSLYGTTVEAYGPYKQAFRRLFVTEPEAEPATVNAVCNEYGVSALLVKSVDEAWSPAGGWVQHMPVMYENPMVKVLGCGYSGAGGRPSNAGSAAFRPPILIDSLLVKSGAAHDGQ